MFLTEWPLWLACVVLVGGGTALSMLGTWSVRRRIGLDKLITNNEVAGFKFAVVGVLYAVLLAFAVIVVWERFNDAESAVAQEAGAAESLFRLERGIAAPAGTAMRDALTAYLNAAIEADWPSMAQGRAALAATLALDRLYAALLTDHPSDIREQSVMAECLTQLDQLSQARRTRLVMSRGAVPGVIWLVLLAGAVVTIGYAFFFGTENLRAQAMMTGALALLIFSILLVIVAIDRPFTGTIQVEAEPLSAVLQGFTGSAPALMPK